MKSIQKLNDQITDKILILIQPDDSGRSIFSKPTYNQNNANALKERNENGDEAPNSSIVSALTVDDSGYSIFF